MRTEILGDAAGEFGNSQESKGSDLHPRKQGPVISPEHIPVRSLRAVRIGERLVFQEAYGGVVEKRIIPKRDGIAVQCKAKAAEGYRQQESTGQISPPGRRHRGVRGIHGDLLTRGEKEEWRVDY